VAFRLVRCLHGRTRVGRRGRRGRHCAPIVCLFTPMRGLPRISLLSRSPSVRRHYTYRTWSSFGMGDGAGPPFGVPPPTGHGGGF
jgi:hypothetical protein